MKMSKLISQSIGHLLQYVFCLSNTWDDMEHVHVMMYMCISRYILFIFRPSVVHFDIKNPGCDLNQIPDPGCDLNPIPLVHKPWLLSALCDVILVLNTYQLLFWTGTPFRTCLHHIVQLSQYSRDFKIIFLYKNREGEEKTTCVCYCKSEKNLCKNYTSN